MAGGLINFEIAGAVRGIMLERKNAGLWGYQSNMQQQVGWKEVQPQLTAPDNRHNKGAAKHCIFFISKQWHVPSCRFQFFHRMAIKRYTCKRWNKKHTHTKRQEGQSWRKQPNILHGMETNSTEPNTVIWSPKGHHNETTIRRTTANTTKKIYWLQYLRADLECSDLIDGPELAAELCGTQWPSAEKENALMWSVGVAMAACSSIRESTLDIIVSPIELVLAPTVATGDGGKRGIEAAEVVWNPTPAICCCIRSPAIIEGASLDHGMPTGTPGMYWLPSDGKSPTEDAMTLSKKWDWWLSVRTWDSATLWQKRHIIRTVSKTLFKTGAPSLHKVLPKWEHRPSVQRHPNSMMYTHYLVVAC